MADAGLPPASPATHQSSGSSTNPNTPRPTTPDRPEPAKEDTCRENPSPGSSTSSGEQRYDIDPTWPKVLDITKVTAVATWSDQSLPDIFFDLHWNTKCGKAFFKLRAMVSLRKGAGRRDGRTSIYLFIYPERIRRLSIDPNPTEKTLGAETVVMDFDMARPPALVLPKTPCEPRNRGSGDILDMFRRLAAQTSFVVHVNIPRRRLPLVLLRQLCTASSDFGLASLDVHASAARLYQGQGGQVVEGDTLAGSAPGAPCGSDEPPPQYSEPSPAEPPPALPSDNTGKKRRRLSSSPDPIESVDPASRKALQSLLESSLSAFKQHFDDRLAVLKKEVAELLGQTEARILDTLRKEMDQCCDGMQEVLEERLHQEMAEVEDSVMRNITEAPLQASLTFPQHPWY